MQDREAVAAIVAGDPRGLAEAYDRYAVPLYTYCRSLLAEPADAADAVQDTFLLATAVLGGLRRPDQLRAWLYAAARADCCRQLRAGRPRAAVPEAGDLAAGWDGDAADGEPADPCLLVGAALSGLNPGERDVVQLSLMHGLDPRELAAACGVSLHQARALRSRARRQLERSLGAVLVARDGRDECPALAALLRGRTGPLTAVMRARISRHVKHCATCGECRRRELGPALRAGAPPLIALAPWFREHVLSFCADATPARRAVAAATAGRCGPDGFPGAGRLPGAPARRYPVRHRYALAAGAGTVAVAAAISAVLLAGSSTAPSPVSGARGSAGPGVMANGRGAPLPDSPAGSPGASGLGPDASPAPRAAGASGPSPSAPLPGGSQAAASSASTPPAAQGTLTLSQRRIVLVTVDGRGVGTLTVTAQGGPVRYSITAPPGLTVSPSSGSLAAGAAATITVTSDSPVSLNKELTVNPGGIAVTVVLGLSL